MANSWSEERVVDALKVMFADGLSANEISKKLNAEYGTALSRNAVIGKIHRLGLVADSAIVRGRRNKPTIPGLTRGRASKPRQIHARPQEAIPEVVRPLPTCEPVDPPLSGCMWPIGDPGTPGFCYCGAKVERRSYCHEHAQIAFQPAKPVNSTEAQKALRTEKHGRFH